MCLQILLIFLIKTSTALAKWPQVHFFLSDPFLQLPTEHSVNVVWFTSEKGKNHHLYTHSTKIKAKSQKLDGWSSPYLTQCTVYRHEVTVNNIPANRRVTYQIAGCDDQGSQHLSKEFSLTSLPPKDKELEILLTSDHQCRAWTAPQLSAANRVNPNFDAIFYAGDFANSIDRYDLWFTHNCSVFSALQGNARTTLNGQTYKGAALIQNTPIFPAFGNHDVPQFGNQLNNCVTPQWKFFNKIFSIPIKNKNTPPYYSVKIGDVYLIVLVVARKYQSSLSHLPIDEKSVQYRWLIDELQSTEYRTAKLHVVMMHHPIYTLNPDPFDFICSGTNTSPFPRKMKSLEALLPPLFEKYGVDLVFNGHDHAWNHFTSPRGVHYLSSSLSAMSQRESIALYRPRKLQPTFPNKKQFFLNRKCLPCPIGPGTVFSILNTRERKVRSYFCELKKGNLDCIEFDSFFLTKNLRE